MHTAPRASAALGCGSGGQLGEVGGGAPVDLGYRVGIVLQRGSAPAGMPEPGGGVAEVEAPGLQT